MGKSKWASARRRALARADCLCQAMIVGYCEIDAVQVHHRLRRSHGGGNADTNLMAVCQACHVWIHHHPELSVEMGFLVNGRRCDRCLRPSPTFLCQRCINEVRTARRRVLDDDGRWIIEDEIPIPFAWHDRE